MAEKTKKNPDRSSNTKKNLKNICKQNINETQNIIKPKKNVNKTCLAQTFQNPKK